MGGIYLDSHHLYFDSLQTWVRKEGTYRDTLLPHVARIGCLACLEPSRVAAHTRKPYVPHDHVSILWNHAVSPSSTVQVRKCLLSFGRFEACGAQSKEQASEFVDFRKIESLPVDLG